MFILDIIKLDNDDVDASYRYTNLWLHFMQHISALQMASESYKPLRHFIVDELRSNYRADIVTTRYHTIRSIEFKTEEDKLVFVLKYSKMIILLIDDPENNIDERWCTQLWVNFTNSLPGGIGGIHDWDPVYEELERLDILIDPDRSYLTFKTEEDKLAFILKWS